MWVCVADELAVPVKRARRGLDLRAVLRAAADAGRARPRPVRRGCLAARRHATTRAAAETATDRSSRGKDQNPTVLTHTTDLKLSITPD